MKSKNLLIIIPLVLISIAAIGLSIYTYIQYQTIAKNPTAFMEKEQETILKKLRQFMELPKEPPTIVTVADRTKLQDQEFFKKALNGDKVIVYEKARRVILFRPSTGKVVDVAPLVVNADTGQQVGTQKLPEISADDSLIELPIASKTPSLTPTPPGASVSATPRPELNP